MTKYDPVFYGLDKSKVNYSNSYISQEATCTNLSCCWKPNNTAGCSSVKGVDGCNVPLCTHNAASDRCSWLRVNNEFYRSQHKLPSAGEFNKIAKYFDAWVRNAGSSGLGFCYFEYFGDESLRDSLAAVCRSYAGCNGASGAQLKRTIKVLPNDVFNIVIGLGGAAGVQGGTTTVEHKRAGVLLATYYVKGGLAGNSATTSAHGAVLSTTTPNGTCYANGNVSCSVNSYSGAKGSDSSGGAGGRVNNTGTATEGGKLYVDGARTAFQRYTTTELNLARGQNATAADFGGGGELKINTSKAKLLKGGNGSNSEKGANEVNLGLDGGCGGTTFLGSYGGCGASIITDLDTSRGCRTKGIEQGLDAKTHNAVSNTFGGSGGGGGSRGEGGSGADGYLRIRWG